MFARMLQDEENSHGLWLPLEQRPVFFAPPGLLVSLLSVNLFYDMHELEVFGRYQHYRAL